MGPEPPTRASPASPDSAAQGGEQAAGLDALVPGAQGRQVRGARAQVRWGQIEGDIALDGGERPGQGELVQAVAQALADSALDGLGVGDHRIQAAIGLEPLDRGLGSALGHPGDVVHAVAHQTQPVHHLPRRHAEPLHHPGGVEQDVGHGIDQADMGADELGQVLISG